MWSILLLTNVLVQVFSPGLCDFTLTLVHTNDVHARFEQFSKSGSDCRQADDIKGRCYGGVARRVTALHQLREQYPDLLLLDAGDQFQGTLWFFIHKGRAASHFMNLLQYDAMALGNHEFDNNVEGLVPFLENITFPALSCNIDFSGEPSLAGLFTKTTIKVVEGESIGIIGFTTTDTPDLSYTGSLVFSDEVTAIQQEADKLKALGVNKIIALGHAGFKTDQAIAREVDGVDLVVGGHTNTFLYTGDHPAQEVPVGDYPAVIDKDSGGVALVVQDYAFAKYLGFLQITFSDTGEVTKWSGNPILMNNTFEQDVATLSTMETWKLPLEASFSKALGRSHVFLDGNRASCRLGECNLGNFVTDAMVRWHLKFPDEAYWANVSLAIHNGGGLRSSIQAGTVTLKDAYNVHPFSNTIDLVELQGRHVRSAFEHSVWDYSRYLQRGRFLQVSGFRVVYDLNKPNGNRVVSIAVLCSDCPIPKFQPLNDDSHYKIVLPSFLVTGGDGYNVIHENMLRHHVYGDVDIDILIRHIESQTPIIAGLEGRIAFVDSQYCHRPGCGTTSATSDVHSSTSSLGFAIFFFVLFQLFWGIRS